MKRLTLIPHSWLTGSRKFRRAAAACAATATLALCAGAASGQTTWTGAGLDDNWFNNNNWDTLLAPNGITVDVIIGSPSPTIANNNVNINSLNVGASGILTVNSSLNFDFGGTAATTLTNAGTINVLNNSDFQLARGVNNSGNINVISAGNLTDLEVISDGATLSGGGTISLSGANARIIGLAGAVLTVNNQTIRGFGQVGVNSLEIVNGVSGMIDADSIGNTLVVDPNAAGMTNQGTMRASSGGILQLTGSGGGTFDNTGGTIEAQNGSTVRLSYATISGGTLATTGTGVISVDTSSDNLLQNVTNAGDLQTQNNSDLGISGTINNTGTITVNNLGNLTDIEVQTGGATLTGGGTVTLQGNNNNSRIDGIAGSTLTIANQTIQGHGNVGTNSIGIVNQTGNLIVANSSGNMLTVDPANLLNMINQGVMRATGGGILQLTGSGGGTFDNTGGMIEAQTGSTVQLSNATISGGTLATTGTGVINVDPGTNSLLSNLTVAGNVQTQNSSDLGISGVINNTGTITVNTLGNLTDIEVQAGGATLTGGGTVTLQGSNNNSRIDGIVGATLAIANQTIQGHGNVGTNTIGIINQTGNLMVANSSGNTLTVDPANLLNMINQGVMRATGGGTLQLTGNGGGNFDNTGGMIEAQTGSTVQLSNATIAGGTVASSGTGVIFVDANSNSFLQNLTLAGNVQTQNSSDLGISGVINNTGTITVNTLGNLTDIEVQAGGATLTGGGTVTLQGSNNNSRIDGLAGSTLTIADQTIQGHGNVGTNTIGIVNGANGVIHANSTGNPLTVDPANALDLANQGTLRASNGGELVLTGSGGGAFSGDGTYEALDNGLLRSDSTAVMNSLSGGVINEGTWRAIDGGNGAAIRLQNNAIVAPTTIGGNAEVELSGANSAFTFNAANNAIDNSLSNVQEALTLRNGRTMALAGGLTNSGAILIDGATTSLTSNGNFSQTAGSLVLDFGTLNSTGSTNVASGGLVAGNGTINGDFTFNGTSVLSPGASPGQLNFGNDLIWGAGGSVLFDLGLNAANSDLIDVNGDLLRAGAGTFSFSFVDNGWVTGQTYDLVAYTNTNFVLGDFSYTNGGGFVGTFGFNGAGNILQLTVNAVPEPTAFMMVSMTVAGLSFGRRRRQAYDEN